jgi:hypothetical protein
MQVMQELNPCVEASYDSNKGRMETLYSLLNILKRQRKRNEGGQDISMQVKTKMFAIHRLSNLKGNIASFLDYLGQYFTFNGS